MRDNEGYTPLHHSAVYGHVSIVNQLIEHGSILDPLDNFGHTPTHAAALHGHVEVVRLPSLLHRDVHDVNLSLRQVNYLCRSGANPNSKDAKGFTALHYAVRGQHESTVRALLGVNADGHGCGAQSNGAQANCMTKKGNTALHIAAEMGEKAVCSLLLEKGMFMQLKDEKKRLTVSSIHPLPTVCRGEC